jgi:transposase
MKIKNWYEINGVKMSKLKHDRIRAFEAMLPQLDERERLNAPDVAARLGCSASNVNLWLRILGRRLNNHNGRTFFKHDTKDWAAKILPIYKATGYMAGKTAEAVGLDKSVVYRWLANNGHLKRKYAERDISTLKFQSYR